ncbi:MAG: FAD-binding protein [Pseudomonadota bacterium]
MAAGQSVVPDVVVAPATIDELSAAVGVARRLETEIIVIGARTGARSARQSPGAKRAAARTIAIVTTRMAEAPAFDVVSGTVTAPAGASLASVEAAVAEAGLALPLLLDGPGSATLGGAVAADSYGVGAMGREPLRAHVAGLRGHTPAGDGFALGDPLIDAGLPDLMSVALEGIGAGVVLSEVTLRLRSGKRDGFAVAHYPSLEAALGLSRLIGTSGQDDAAVELLNAEAVAHLGSAFSAQPITAVVAWRARPYVATADEIIAASISASGGTQVMSAGSAEQTALMARRLFSALATLPRHASGARDIEVALAPNRAAEVLSEIDALAASAGLSIPWRLSARDGFIAVAAGEGFGDVAAVLEHAGGRSIRQPSGVARGAVPTETTSLRQRLSGSGNLVPPSLTMAP